jgi:hypothetical protein
VGRARPPPILVAGFRCGPVDPGRCSVIAPARNASHASTRHAGTNFSDLDEARLTLPMTAPLQYHGVAHSNGAEKPSAAVSKTPVLAHRMKHDKSILALVVSSQYIFAGTQGGEILVSGDEVDLFVVILAKQGRSTASTRTSAGESSARTKAACWGSVYRRTKPCCFLARRTLSSMQVTAANTEGALVDIILGLVHIHLPAPLRPLVALRYRRHFLRRILVLPPHCISWSAEYQHTSKHGPRRGRSSADRDSGTTSRKKTRDQPRPSHRIPPNARTASSIHSALEEYLHRSPAVRTADQVMR